MSRRPIASSTLPMVVSRKPLPELLARLLDDSAITRLGGISRPGRAGKKVAGSACRDERTTSTRARAPDAHPGNSAPPCGKREADECENTDNMRLL